MTPEEELARMEALRTGRGEMLPPIPPPGEVLDTGEGPTDLDAEIMAAAEEAEAEEQQAAAAAPPPMPAPTLAETRAALPPPIAIPQWEARRTGTPRGRTAHKVASGLIALLGGGNSYGRRVARENQQADVDYARARQEYELAQRDRAQKIEEQRDQQEIPKFLRARFGVPPGTTYGDFKRMIQQSGYFAAVRQAESRKGAADLEAQRQGNRVELEDVRFSHQMALAKLRGQLRKQQAAAKAGKGGGKADTFYDGLIDVLDEMEKDPGYQDLATGFANADEQITPERMESEFVRRFSGSGQDAIKLAKDYMGFQTRERDKNKQGLRERDTAWRRTSENTAHARKAAETWREISSQVPDLRGAIATIHNTPTGNFRNDEAGQAARRLQGALISMAANYIASKGGKAITATERELIGGRISGLIDVDVLGEEGGILSSALGAFKRGVKRQVATADDVREFAKMVDDSLEAQLTSASAGPEGPQRLFNAGYRDRAINEVKARWRTRHPDQPEPIGWAPNAKSRQVWDVIYERGGEPEQFRLYY